MQMSTSLFVDKEIGVVMDGKHERNPEDLPLVTLDNNALIALRNDEAAAPAVRELLEMNRTGLIVANVTMSTAMEAQREVGQSDWQGQRTRIESLGIARDHIFTSSRSIGFETPEAPGVPMFAP